MENNNIDKVRHEFVVTEFIEQIMLYGFEGMYLSNDAWYSEIDEDIILSCYELSILFAALCNCLRFELQNWMYSRDDSPDFVPLCPFSPIKTEIASIDKRSKNIFEMALKKPVTDQGLWEIYEKVEILIRAVEQLRDMADFRPSDWSECQQLPRDVYRNLCELCELWFTTTYLPIEQLKKRLAYSLQRVDEEIPELQRQRDRLEKEKQQLENQKSRLKREAELRRIKSKNR